MVLLQVNNKSLLELEKSMWNTFQRISGRKPLEFVRESDGTSKSLELEKDLNSSRQIYEDVLKVPSSVNRRRRQKLDSESQPNMVESSFECTTCNVRLPTQTALDDHLTQIPHLVGISEANAKNGLKPTEHVTYSLQPTSVGYRILQDSGWEHGTGLGKGKTGRLNPISTRVKNDLLGIGMKPVGKKRVTHSRKEIDAETTKSSGSSRNPHKTRKQIEMEQKRDESKRQMIMQYLSN